MLLILTYLWYKNKAHILLECATLSYLEEKFHRSISYLPTNTVPPQGVRS